MIRTFAAAGRLLNGLLALVVLIALLGGIPWLLVTFIGWPLPDHMPGLSELSAALTSPLNDQTILKLLAVMAWALWLLFLRDVVAEAILAAGEAIDARRGRPRSSHCRPVGPVRLVAAILVGAIAGAIILEASRGAVDTGTAHAANAPARSPAVAVVVGPAQPSAALPNSAAISHAGPRPALTAHPATSIATPTATGRTDGSLPTWARDAPGRVHHVIACDNLWNIAKHKLGDPYRWREIYVLNRGKPQFNGYALTDPDEIHVGWVLVLPARNPAEPSPAPPNAIGGGQSESPARGNPTPAKPVPANPRPASPAPASPALVAPSPTVSAPVGPSPASSPDEAADEETADDRQYGITLPSQAWVSLGLAASIAAAAALLRLQRRRRARLGFPILLRTTPQPAPVPASLTRVDVAGSRQLTSNASDEHSPPGVLPTAPAMPAPIGVDQHGEELSLFDLSGPGLALCGAGTEGVARAVLASVLSTGALEHLAVRPVVVTTIDTLARLLPRDAPRVGLDPHGITYDGERLIVLADGANAVTHAEEEMIHRRRLLDSLGADSVGELNTRADHVEDQPAYVLLASANQRYAARICAIAAHRSALHLHTVLLGGLDGLPSIDVAADGTVIDAPEVKPLRPNAATVARLATLSARDLVDVLALVAEVAPRPEPGTDGEDAFAREPAADANDEDVRVADAEVKIPTSSTGEQAPVRLGVLGPIIVATESGTVSTGMRSGSYATLALLAAHPQGRTLDQIADGLYPDIDHGAAVNRVRTDINTARRVLRAATGHDEAMFVVFDPATSRYHIDPDAIEVDLWRMLAAIGRANTTDEDDACLACLREAVGCYRGDFAEGQDRAWVTDYATTYRYQILNALARIAEILETDQPDQAVAALEIAIEHDPVNEELYQRVIRIQGRQGRPDAVRRTLRRLEERLAELGEAEPSEATRRIAHRQLTPSPARGG